MNKFTKIIKILIVYCIILLITPKKYKWYLPTIPIYKNNNEEIIEVEKMILSRTEKDIEFFKKTDESISYAFAELVPETFKQLHNITIRKHIILIIQSLKYIINRPRPQQINTLLNVLPSKTADTPAFPAGHAFQAYYLAKILGKKYPHIKSELDNIAYDCDLTRIKAGIHYPSDGEFSKKLVDIFF
jgi:hypothetical protein